MSSLCLKELAFSVPEEKESNMILCYFSYCLSGLLQKKKKKKRKRKEEKKSNCWLILHQNDKFHELKSPWVSPIDHLILKTLQYVLWSSFHRDKHCRILKRKMRTIMYFPLYYVFSFPMYFPVSKNCVLSVMSEMLWRYQTKMWEGALYEKRKWCWEFVKCI